MVSSYQIQGTVIREVLDHVGRRFDPLKLPGRFPPLFEDFSSGGVAGGNPMCSRRGFRGAGHFMNANRIVNWVAIAAIVFGVVTVLTGGRALFGSLESRADFGNVVPFVLWFNFLAGFVYIVAGAGLLLCRRWAVYTSLFVAGSTILVFVAFCVHVIGGGAFERRTIGALTIRSLFWIAVTMVSIRASKRTPNWWP